MKSKIIRTKAIFCLSNISVYNWKELFKLSNELEMVFSAVEFLNFFPKTKERF